MISQAKVVNYLGEKLSNQLANVQNAQQRNDVLKNAANSQQVEHMQDITDADRLHERLDGAKKNPQVQDRVHISPEAQELYKAQESKLDRAPERAHAHAQKTEEEVAPKAKEPTGALGNMEHEA